MKRVSLLFTLLLCLCSYSFAGVSPADSGSIHIAGPDREISKDSIKILRKQKWKAALLAFPLIGITGAHRVYLGTAPYMPLIYLATVGGLGILPLIDFVVIISTPPEKLGKFKENDQVFMWAE